MTRSSDQLPDEFWELHEESIGDDRMRRVYDDVVRRLRQEAEQTPNFGTLQDMVIERTAFLYTYIRDRERAGVGEEQGFTHERNYKELVQLWLGMAGQLMKAESNSVNSDEIRKHVLQAVSSTINDVLSDMHPDVADGLRRKFASAFEAANF